MRKSVVLFKAIDVFFHPLQNYKIYSNVTVEKNVQYDENVKEALGDIFYDKKYQANGKYPVILNIHGGGYVAGDKKHRQTLCSYYADKGWFVFNINYRLGPEYSFPVANIDCINGLNYLKKLEEKYNLDLNRVIVTGDSSGAYLSAFIIAAMTNPDLRGKLKLPEIEIKVAGLMAYCGLYDLIKTMKSKIPLGFARDVGSCFLGIEVDKQCSCLETFPYIKEMAPANYVNENWCPTFLAMSKKDLFCKGQGELLEEKLQAVGVPLYTHKTKKLIENHCYMLNMFQKISRECFVEVDKFMEMIKNS